MIEIASRVIFKELMPNQQQLSQYIDTNNRKKTERCYGRPEQARSL